MCMLYLLSVLLIMTSQGNKQNTNLKIKKTELGSNYTACGMNINGPFPIIGKGSVKRSRL